MKCQNTVLENFVWVSKHFTTAKNGKNQAKMGLLPTMRLIHPQAQNTHLLEQNVRCQQKQKNSSYSGYKFSLRVTKGVERMQE